MEGTVLALEDAPMRSPVLRARRRSPQPRFQFEAQPSCGVAVSAGGEHIGQTAGGVDVQGRERE